MSNNITNILSIDVEDYFQINAFSDVIRYEDWDSFESRVEVNTYRLLDLIDSVGEGKSEVRDQRSEIRDQRSSPEGYAVPGKPEDSRRRPEAMPCQGSQTSEVGSQKSESRSQISEAGSRKAETLYFNKQQATNNKHTKNIRGTFFVLGWIAERYPDLVKEIHSRGHEVACHGYAHQLIFKQDSVTFRDDVKKAKNILENITGTKVLGYRAPTYTITKRTMWALDVLHELGFKYDSSIFPISHDVYGYPGSPRFPYIVLMNGGTSYEFVAKGNYPLEEKHIFEFPISTYSILNKNIPVGGGGYFRLFPYMITRTLLKRINNKEAKPFVFYLHPWEIDPGIPKMDKAGRLSKFRTYVNLDKTLGRLGRLIRDFDFTCFADVI